MESDYSPAQALADAAGARNRAAARVVTPWWYHPALGLILGVLVAAIQFPNHHVAGFFAMTGAALALLALIQVYQRRYGVWFSIDELAPRSRPWWIAHTVLVLASVAVAMWIRFGDGEGPNPWGWGAAGAVALGTVILGRILDSRLRADIRAGESGTTS